MDLARLAKVMNHSAHGFLRSPGALAALVSLSLLAGTSTVSGQAAEEPPPRPVEVVKARMASPPGHRHLQEIGLWHRDGGRVDVARQGDRVAYDKAGEDGLYDLWVVDVTGDTGQRCLTCESYDFRKFSVYNPTWHPGGEILVFQVQEVARKLDLGPIQMAGPLRAVHSELWAITADGRSYWQLTRVGERGGALLDPRFSHEGSRLMWSERMTNVAEPWGSWALRLADFEIRRGVPRLGDPEKLQPWGSPELVIGHDFTPDDRGVLLSGNRERGRAGVLDLGIYRRESGFERLTADDGQRDEVAAFGPRGDVVVWATSRALAPVPWNPKLPWRTDLWRMSPDGAGQERLTFFNDPDSSLYLGEALIDDLSWNPRGDRLLIHVVSAGLDGERVDEGIYEVIFDETYRR